jgi:hypothetical protein
VILFCIVRGYMFCMFLFKFVTKIILRILTNLHVPFYTYILFYCVILCILFCVNVYHTTAKGCQPIVVKYVTSYQIYHIYQFPQYNDLIFALSIL